MVVALHSERYLIRHVIIPAADYYNHADKLIMRFVANVIDINVVVHIASN